jgi:hypothetical protein
MEALRTVAKVTQARYGVISQPAHLDSRKKRATVQARANKRRRISNRAHPGDWAQKKRKDQRKFRKSWTPKAARAPREVGETETLRQTRKKATPIMR